MDLTIFYIMIGLGLSGFVIQRSKVLTILIYFFMWTLMWTKYTADYMAYFNIYYSPFEFRDIGYMLLCSIGRGLGLSFFEFFISLGLLATSIYCWFTLKYARKNSMVAAMFLLFISLFDIVQFRNFLGFAIVLCFIPLLFDPTRNKLILYGIGVALASTVHMTMSFYMIFIFMNKDWFSTKNIRKILIPLIILSIGLYIGFDYYTSRAENLITMYNKRTSDLTKWMIALLLIGNVVFVYCWSRRSVELDLNESQSRFALSKGKVETLMNFSLLFLFPLSFQSLTVMRLYKYMAIVNFAFISNHMARYTNWKLLPQTFIVAIYGLSYLILFIFIHGPYFIKGVAKPIFFTNSFWPTFFSYF